MGPAGSRGEGLAREVQGRASSDSLVQPAIRSWRSCGGAGEGAPRLAPMGIAGTGGWEAVLGRRAVRSPRWAITVTYKRAGAATKPQPGPSRPSATAAAAGGGRRRQAATLPFGGVGRAGGLQTVYLQSRLCYSQLIAPSISREGHPKCLRRISLAVHGHGPCYPSTVTALGRRLGGACDCFAGQ